MEGSYLTRDILRYIMTKHCSSSDAINLGLTCIELFDFLCSHYEMGLWWKNRMIQMRIKDACPSANSMDMLYCFKCKAYERWDYWFKHDHISSHAIELCNSCFGLRHIHTLICPIV